MPYSTHLQATKWQVISSFSVLFFYSTFFLFESAPSYGSVILLIISIIYFLCNRKQLNTALKPAKETAFVFLFFAAILIISNLLNGDSSRSFERPARVLLYLIIFSYFIKQPPKPMFFWIGILIGSFITGCHSLYQSFALNIARTNGHMGIIEYGNISLLFGVLSLVSTRFFQGRRLQPLWYSLAFLAFVLGLTASLLSGTRGGWISLPVITFLILKTNAGHIKPKILLIIICTILIGLVISYNIPSTNIKHRTTAAFSDVELYFSGENKQTSIGLRFEMWIAATKAFKEKPIFGWGEKGYLREKKDLVNQNIISSGAQYFEHPHNELLNMASKYGIIGVFALLMLFFIPLKEFYKNLKSSDANLKALSISGVLIIVATIDFGLSNVFFNRYAGLTVYFISIITLISMIKGLENGKLQHG